MYEAKDKNNVVLYSFHSEAEIRKQYKDRKIASFHIDTISYDLLRIKFETPNAYDPDDSIYIKFRGSNEVKRFLLSWRSKKYTALFVDKEYCGTVHSKNYHLFLIRGA